MATALWTIFSISLLETNTSPYYLEHESRALGKRRLILFRPDTKPDQSPLSHFFLRQEIGCTATFSLLGSPPRHKTKVQMHTYLLRERSTGPDSFFLVLAADNAMCDPLLTQWLSRFVAALDLTFDPR